MIPLTEDKKMLGYGIMMPYSNIFCFSTTRHALSLGIDKSWRQKAIRYLKPFHPEEIMDVATGTGDFAILACRELKPKSLIGTDISEGMMNVGRKKVAQAQMSDIISFAREDCTDLSFAPDTFDAVTVAFGIRNFDDLDKGLSEICRVLKPGGHLVILELSTPDRFPMKQLFTIYSKVVIPFMGRRLSKDNSAYTYLPQSIRAFPQGEIMNIDDLLCVGAVDNILVSSTIGRNKLLIPGEVISAIINGTDELLAELREMGVGVYATGGETADVGDLVRTIIVDSTVTCRMHRFTHILI